MILEGERGLMGTESTTHVRLCQRPWVHPLGSVARTLGPRLRPPACRAERGRKSSALPTSIPGQRDPNGVSGSVGVCGGPWSGRGFRTPAGRQETPLKVKARYRRQWVPLGRSRLSKQPAGSVLTGNPAPEAPRPFRRLFHNDSVCLRAQSAPSRVGPAVPETHAQRPASDD